MTRHYTRRDAIKLAAATAMAAAGLATPGVRQAIGSLEAAEAAELILHRGRITTMDLARPAASAVAVRGGGFVAAGDDADVMPLLSDRTRLDRTKRTNRPPLVGKASPRECILGGSAEGVSARPGRTSAVGKDGCLAVDDVIRHARPAEGFPERAKVQ